ncbi:hypothetical protein [Brucella anthropi]|uniref:hypothetical protein n=1 Tax=Brucella anthropi TaxID=529 RepID=UPI00244791A1|nr:hypothetical protein [Brucella anthropi]MDH0369044.1 hypothetical protein [Brucella anthropi]
MADKQTVKVGDKVKSLVTQLDVREGATYEVKNINFDGDIWVTDDVGDRFYLATDEFELLPVADATGKPDFKVGDRVRVLSDDLPWASADEVGTVQNVNTRDRDCFVKFETERMGGHTWYVRWDNLELAPSLTIETGKFYRTRDGRKVGPYEHSFSNIWIAGKGNHSTARFADGRVSHHHESTGDLIAEWIDEPAGNDNAPATKPAIVALIENGQPKPSEQPKVHKSEESATDEAERLAVKYPGQKFGVFVLADSRIADVVIRRAA